MKSLKESINESMSSYANYLFNKYKMYGEFENVKNGYVRFVFSTEGERNTFIKRFDKYADSFEYSKSNQGLGEYFLKIDLKTLEDIIINTEIPKILETMAQKIGII